MAIGIPLQIQAPVGDNSSQATPGSTGFNQAIHDGLLALAATTVPWWSANSYPRPFDMGDVQTAGLS